jgi:hypothetical protein
MQLARLLGEPERAVKKTIARLEALSGYHSEDVRLLTESRQLLRAKISTLGLDPDDTTAEELYHRLQAKLKSDLDHLDRAWDLSGGQTDRSIKILESVSSESELLAIKGSTMKLLFKTLPPKKTQKLLGYRSLDSMLKREDTRAVLAAALSVESAQWSSKLAQKVNQLKTSDYELRKIKFIAANPKSKAKPVAAVPLMAAVCINASEQANFPAAGLVLLGLEAEVVLQAENWHLSGRQFSKDFNKTAERLFSGYAPLTSSLENDFIGMEDYKVKTEEPYAKFSRLHPALAWWCDCGHIAMDNEGAVSLHIGDNLLNMAHAADFSNRYNHNFVASLKRQLASRYLNYEAVKNYLADQIDDTFISLESISAKQLVPDFEEIRNL